MAAKTGFLFVFDRVTGKPIWPITERAVPASDVPGEEAATTQPVPSKPAAFAKQGFTADDVVDFTPADPSRGARGDQGLSARLRSSRRRRARERS